MLGGQDHVGAVRQHDDLLRGHLVDRRQQVVCGRVERWPAVDRVHAQLVEEAREARPADDRDRAAARRPGAVCASHIGAGRRADPRGCALARGAVRPLARAAHAGVALQGLRSHVCHVEPRHLARVGEHSRGALGLVGVQMHL